MGEAAVIMSVKEGKAVVLAAGGRFFKIKDRNFHIGQRIVLEPSLFFMPDRISFSYEMLKKKLVSMRDRLKYKGLIILTSAALLIPTSAYAATKYVPWTYVSLDSGAVSIQYQLNARGEILSAETLSEEGQKVMEEVKMVRFEKFEKTVDRTLSMIQSSETTENEPVLIGISSRFGNGDGTVRTLTENRKDPAGPEIQFTHLDWSEKGRAREKDLSIGHYVMENLPPEERPEHFPVPEKAPEIKPEENSQMLTSPDAQNLMNPPDNAVRDSFRDDSPEYDRQQPFPGSTDHEPDQDQNSADIPVEMTEREPVRGPENGMNMNSEPPGFSEMERPLNGQKPPEQGESPERPPDGPMNMNH
jgi:hypothetical protein